MAINNTESLPIMNSTVFVKGVQEIFKLPSEEPQTRDLNLVARFPYVIGKVNNNKQRRRRPTAVAYGEEGEDEKR